MNAFLDEIGSPIGGIALATNEEGELLGLWFRDGSNPMGFERWLKRQGYTIVKDDVHTAAWSAQLAEFFARRRLSFDLPISRQGTEFQLAVWDELSRIPFGETRTYGQIAAAIGHPGLAREVGASCAVNPLPVVVPCHRVVGADGSLKGYSGGIHLKERLLVFEGSRLLASA